MYVQMYLPSLTCYTTKSTSMRLQLFLYLSVSKSILKCFRKLKETGLCLMKESSTLGRQSYWHGHCRGAAPQQAQTQADCSVVRATYKKKSPDFAFLNLHPSKSKSLWAFLVGFLKLYSFPNPLIAQVLTILMI